MSASIIQKIDLLLALTPTTQNLNFFSNLHSLIHSIDGATYRVTSRELQTRLQNSRANISVRSDGLKATRKFRDLLIDLTGSGVHGALHSTLGHEAVKDLKDEGLLRKYRDARLAGLQKLGMLVLKRKSVNEEIKKFKTTAGGKETMLVLTFVAKVLDSMIAEEEVGLKLFDLEVRNREPFAGAGAYGDYFDLRLEKNVIKNLLEFHGTLLQMVNSNLIIES
ncbi:unnamed protein product [Tuber aestivum]|uniref:Uncharacterized protein n=1 Tax=Tuber aestivum TaxID=59557 RepID=A0A292QA62_9PEZI|nr:unnamed protein product [Tuber aestivum]